MTLTAQTSTASLHYLVRPAADPSGKAPLIVLLHGVADRVFSVSYARDASAFLKTQGIALTYHEYPDGHTISLAMLDDLLGWLR